MANGKKYTVGCDFGTLSMRTVIVCADDGDIVSECVYEYPNGVISRSLPDSSVTLAGPHWALQDPRDYMEAMCVSIPRAVSDSGVDKRDIIGIGVDFTTCTVMPMTKDGAVLCELDRFKDRPHAWVKLWKNHTANDEAEMMTAYCKSTGSHVLDNYGFRASSEWFFPKILEVLREDPEVYSEAWTFIEAGDYVVYKLIGEIKRSSCLAGAKGLYDNETHSYPPKSFFKALDERFENVVEDKHLSDITLIGSRAGGLTADMADKLGLMEGICVCPAHADAAVALIGAGIVHPDEIIFAMGTSTCHIAMSEKKVHIPGMFGMYKDGVMPGYFTYEAGQGAVGDIFDWFTKNMVPESYYEQANKRNISIHALLAEKASLLKIGESGLLALDWMNGNRCIIQDSDLTGLIMGLTLQTRPEEIYRALVEATAFGTRVIMDQFASYDIDIRGIYACGGLAHKSPFIMQIYADVLNKPIKLTAIAQTSALSSGIFAAVAATSAAGGFDSFEEAAAHMVKPPKRIFEPIPENVAAYEPIFGIYREMHDYLGYGDNNPMKRLRSLQKQAVEGK